MLKNPFIATPTAMSDISKRVSLKGTSGAFKLWV